MTSVKRFAVLMIAAVTLTGCASQADEIAADESAREHAAERRRL